MKNPKTYTYYKKSLTAPGSSINKPSDHGRHIKENKEVGRILIHNAPFIFSCRADDKLVCLKNHSIEIENDTIKKVAPQGEIAEKKYDIIYDAGKRGGIVITPGLFNTHTHLPMYLMRSAMMLDTNDTIEQTIAAMPAWERTMDDNDYTYSTIGDISEQQKHGVTSSLCHFAVYNPIENAARITHHNVINAISVASNTHPENNPKLIEKLIKDNKNSHSKIAIAVHYLYKAKPSILKEISRLIKKYDLLFTCHMAESQTVADECVRIHGLREVEVLRKYGLLNDRTVLSHAIYVNSEEIKILSASRIGIAHLPTSNTIHKSGTFPIWKFFKAGARGKISLGTDSVVSKSRMDILTEAYQARLTHLYKKRLKFGTLFKMMTINGAAITHMPDRGRILPGFKADLCFWKLRDRGFIPYDENNPFTLLGNLITHNGRTVRDLMINGKFIIKNRRHLFIDESRLLDNLQTRHMEMRKRIDKQAG